MKNLILQRFNDSLDIIRRSVFDFFTQLEIDEIQTAYFILDKEFIEIIFNSIRDDDAAIRKTGLQVIHNCLTKPSSQEFKQVFKNYVEQNKLSIFKMTIPSNKDNSKNDPATTVKCLQLIE